MPIECVCKQKVPICKTVDLISTRNGEKLFSSTYFTNTVDIYLYVFFGHFKDFNDIFQKEIFLIESKCTRVTYRGFFPILLILIVQKKIFCPVFSVENLHFFPLKIQTRDKSIEDVNRYQSTTFFNYSVGKE